VAPFLRRKTPAQNSGRKQIVSGGKEPILGIPLVPRVEAVQVHIPPVIVPVRVHHEDGSILYETPSTPLPVDVFAFPGCIVFGACYSRVYRTNFLFF